MLHEDPGNVSSSAVGGLSDQIRELRESIELPLMNPELFLRVGIKSPKVTVGFGDLYIVWQGYASSFISANIAIYRGQNFTCVGCASLWTSWHWQDFIS